MNLLSKVLFQIAVLALLGVLLLAPTGANASAIWSGVGAAISRNNQWCGSNSADWICSWRGKVFADDEILPPRSPRQVGLEGTKVTTGPTAEARVTFKGRARCTFGGGGEYGEYFAHHDEDVLFRQVLGYSSCINTRGHGGNEASILCSSEEHCPATLRATGAFFTKSFTPGGAQSSSTETFVRRARIVACTGSLRVRVEDEEGGYSEVAGGATGNNRFVVEIEVTERKTRDETVEGGSTAIVEAHEDSTRADAVGHPVGPGRCTGSVEQEQEQTFEP